MNYELILLLKNKEEVAKIKDYLLKNNVKISREENWGEKPLAYKIKSFKKAYYYLIELMSEKDNIIKLRQWLNYNDKIMRFFIVIS